MKPDRALIDMARETVARGDRGELLDKPPGPKLKFAPVDPTPAQLEVLRAIHSYRQARGFSPTFRELATLLRKATSTIVKHIDGLYEIGFIECMWPHDQRPRNFRPTQRAEDFMREHQ